MPQHLPRHRQPHQRVHDAVEGGAVAALGVAVAEDAPAERGPVDGPGGVGADAEGGAGVEGLQQVRGRGAEVREDEGVAPGAGEDGAVGEGVGVDGGEVVGGGAEEGGDGGFAGGEGAGQADEDHGCGEVVWRRGAGVGVGCGILGVQD